MRIDPEQAEDADYAEHTESDSSHGEYDRQIVWKEREEVDQPVQGKDKGKNCLPVGLVRVEEVCRPYAQYIFDGKMMIVISSIQFRAAA